MSIVAATESRAESRTIYLPPKAGMAHRSYLSPDRKWVLVVEMLSGSWLPCRLTPFDGSSVGKPLGPAPAQCVAAGWSPDGKWMYFSTDAGNGTHTWRQRFPDGKPEQVTFGVTEERGISFAPDGRSFVTSIGTTQNTVWIHDSHGDRQVTSEGFSFQPSISPDAKKLYYLVRGSGTSSFIAGSLWVTDLDSGQRERLLPDFEMRQYEISLDGQRVVFVASEHNGRASIWLAPLNGRGAPHRVADVDGRNAHFGVPDEVIFTAEENVATYLYQVKEDGTGLKKLFPASGLFSMSVSPDGLWILGWDSRTWGALFAFPARGGAPLRICGTCSPPNGTKLRAPEINWTPDARFLYLKYGTGIYAIPLKNGEVLPAIPSAGFDSARAVAALPGAQLVTEQENVYPGPNPSIYAFTKPATHRNIYRVTPPSS
jgi:Tol biopolymer transport system component